MKLFTIALDNLVVESTINGFAKGRSRSWKIGLFDGRHRPRAGRRLAR